MEQLKEISLEGFQVVSGDMFKHLPRKFDATCTVWPSSIGFNKQAIDILGHCEFVRIEVNSRLKGLLVVPVSSKDPDSIRWVKNQKKIVARKVECAKFAKQLYERWGWNPNLIYRATGRLVTSDNKIMLYYNFNEVESWAKPEAGGVSA